jgi:cytochrome c oxidase cbb3-type subunit 3/ubiquinol-cytochrome c reductase cytochrome c subunit
MRHERPTMWRTLALALAILASMVASGTLECTPPEKTLAVAHGRETYSRMCAVCHGADGEGYKADQAPALGQADFLASVSDAYLVDAITHGRVGTTMSAWGRERGGPLPPDEVKDVITFLRSLGSGRVTKLDERPVSGDAGRGGVKYIEECAKCHGPKGLGGPYEGIGNRELLSQASNGFLREAMAHGRKGTMMPAFEAQLGDPGIDDVLALLRSWEAATPKEARRLAPPAKPPPLPLGPVPLNPSGPEPVGFDTPGGFTKADIVHRELARGARMGILDARAPPDYVGEHIDGAVSVPFYDPEPYLTKLPKDAWLVAYCGCPHAESGQLAQKLRAKGFTKVTVLDEGLHYWSTHFNANAKGEKAARFGTKRGNDP